MAEVCTLQRVQSTLSPQYLNVTSSLSPRPILSVGQIAVGINPSQYEKLGDNMDMSTMGNGPGPPGESQTTAILSESNATDNTRAETSRHQPQSSGDVESAQPQECCCHQTCCQHCSISTHHRKLIVGIFLMVLGAVCWVGVTQSAGKTYQPSYHAPFFLIYFSTSWLIIVYPLYLTLRFASSKGKLPLGETFREGIRAYGDDGWSACPYRIFIKCAGFTLLWDSAAYIYVRALGFKESMDVIALFATNANFVYLLSWIVLQKKFIAVRIVAFIVGMTGTIFLIYMQSGFASNDMWGAILVIIATAAAALYKVLFRKIIGDVPLSQVSFSISCMGVFNVVTMWPMLLLLYFTNAEPIDWPQVPWRLLCITAAFMMGCKLVMTFGVEVTYSLLLHSIFILAIPFCLVSDAIQDPGHFHISGVQIGSYLLIILSFFVNILPDNWHETLLKTLHIKQRIDSPDDTHLSPRQRLRNSHPHSSSANP